jgi:hypothetical protein
VLAVTTLAVAEVDRTTLESEALAEQVVQVVLEAEEPEELVKLQV